ncbi:DUF2721 domain-containing protein [Methylorubrum extorquens]|uniref:DUF2721 domain-containing protein n=1 Tax=Methylorubrum extorquens TaxID=408 RepID=UPI0022385AD2|nr:DUF2721 domain-containing protein [Methylorubrum extorquens]UYW24777.1 DUF2721 domain-containing protein [Methylorubrum extorquens]
MASATTKTESSLGIGASREFLLAAVAALLTLLVSRLTLIADLVRTLLAERDEAGAVEREVLLGEALRRTRYTRWAITLSMHSGIVTGWMVVLIFVDALFGFHNGRSIALAFIAAMVLFTTSLIFLLLEIRLSVADLVRIPRGSREDGAGPH